MNILVCVKPALAGADSAMVTREKAALEISRQDLLAYSCALWLRRQAGGSVTLLAMSSANAVECLEPLYAYGGRSDCAFEQSDPCWFRYGSNPPMPWRPGSGMRGTMN